LLNYTLLMCNYTVSYDVCVCEAPVIVSPPEHKKNVTGSNVAILCEAKGFPIPTVEWTWMRVDGQMVYLPSQLIITVYRR